MILPVYVGRIEIYQLISLNHDKTDVESNYAIYIDLR
jgi:hypothetical protein